MSETDGRWRHGMTGTKTYNSWAAMKQRCRDEASKSWANYGGRGVVVCDRWQTFANFFEDMGERPADKTLDRINPSGNYEPGNCRWATRVEQAANRRPYVGPPVVSKGRPDHGCRCGARWWGLSMAHCASCHRTFGGVQPFDHHRRADACIEVTASRNFYESRPGVWSHITEKAREKAATAPKKAVS